MPVEQTPIMGLDQNPNDKSKLRYTTDGANWVQFADLGEYFRTILEGQPGSDLRCRVATYITATVKNLINQMINDKDASPDLFSLAVGATSAASGVIILGAFAINPVLGVGATVASAMAVFASGCYAVLQQFSTSTAEALRAKLTSEFYETIQCQLYCLLDDNATISTDLINQWVQNIRDYGPDDPYQQVANLVASHHLAYWTGLAAIGAAIPAFGQCELPCADHPCCHDWRTQGAGGWQKMQGTTPDILFDTHGMYAVPTDSGVLAAVYLRNPLTPGWAKISTEGNSYISPSTVQVFQMDEIPIMGELTGEEHILPDSEGFYTITKEFFWIEWALTPPAAQGDPGNNPVFYKFCYRPVPQTWSHEFNFATSDGGFVADVLGLWAGGVWQHQDGDYSGGHRRIVNINRVFSSAQITYIEVEYNLQKGDYQGSVAGLLVAADGTSTNLINIQPSSLVNGNGQVETWSGSRVMTNLYLRLQASGSVVSKTAIPNSRFIGLWRGKTRKTEWL